MKKILSKLLLLSLALVFSFSIFATQSNVQKVSADFTNFKNPNLEVDSEHLQDRSF